MRTDARSGAGRLPGQQRRKLYFFLAACLLCVSVAVGGICLRCHPHPDAALVRSVDSLNTQVYRLRYVRPDRSYALAMEAYERAKGYPDGRSEALCHQMYQCFLRMDYATERKLYDRLQASCGNQIELLVAEVNMMMFCQRAAQNRQFYDYYNRALERIRRIMEEYDGVTGRDKERLEYAMVEFRLTSATNFMNLMQVEEAEEELAEIDFEGYIRKDDALRTYFYYLSALAALNHPDGRHLTEALDYILRAYTLAEREGNIYFRAKAGLVLAEMMVRRKDFGYLKDSRTMELEYLCHTFFPEENEDVCPALRLAGALVRQSLADADSCASLMLQVDGLRTLGMVRFAGGDYCGALEALEKALHRLNAHHHTYYPTAGDGKLVLYANHDAPAVDLTWARDADVQTLPIQLAYIRENLSAVFAALDDKRKSDYNRNLYLDLMDFSRQDKSLESRATIVARDNRTLHTLSWVVILSALTLCFLLLAYARKWKRRNARRLALLNDMSGWFMDVASGHRGNDMEKVLGTYPWMKKEKRILSGILRPFADWTEKNRSLSGQVDEELTQLHEDCLRGERQVIQEKRRNVSKRAKVSLVHSIVPFIDRMLYTVHRMEQKGRSVEGWQYVGELADEINRYNRVLTEWIRMNRGELELTVESFPLQPLFSLLEKGEYAFRRAGISFTVEPTQLWVKADKALTFFMLNTLADNARKFTPSGGRVEVSAVDVGEAVELAVTDTGCGLSPADVELIRSSKVYDARLIGQRSPDVSGKKGGGFGLMNCKGIIGKYRAAGDLFAVCRFDIQSEEHKGSRFSFRLPKGVARVMCLAMGSLLGAVPQSLRAEVAVDSSLIRASVRYADSVYFSNLRGDYAAAFCWADSAFACINSCYAHTLPDSLRPCPLTVYAGGGQELEWWRAGVWADFHLIMSIRNELAVAALALHDWEVYDFNNRQFAHLYRLVSKDDSLERFYARQQEIKAALSVSLVLLVLMLLAALVVAYVVYFRRRMLFRFNAMQVLEANHGLLAAVEAQGTGGGEELAERMLSVAFTRLEELHETYAVRLWLCRPDGTKSVRYAVGGTSGAMVAESLLKRAYHERKTVFDEETNTQAYPLVLSPKGGERACIGAMAVSYGSYRMQREDFVFESFIVNYLSILLYEAVVRRRRERDTVEDAGNERQKIFYERARLRVQNQILDNCLSAIKHETMYYPSRIKQMLRTLGREEDTAVRRESVHELKRLVEYYKEIYALLVAQADRQAGVVYFKGERIPLHLLIGRWQEDTARRLRKSGSRTHFKVWSGLSADDSVYADEALLHYLLEALTKEWMARMPEEEGHELTLELSEDSGGRFVRFTLSSSAPLYTPEEVREIFTPDVSRRTYLVCKEIVREIDKMNNCCGCRIEMEALPDAGCRIGFTVPKYE